MSYEETLKTYDNKKLEKLANDEIIYPKGFEHYRNILHEHLDAWEIPHSKHDGDHEDYAANELEHEELQWDLSEIINHLAQLVLDEREKRSEIIEEIKSTLTTTINSLENIFDE